MLSVLAGSVMCLEDTRELSLITHEDSMKIRADSGHRIVQLGGMLVVVDGECLFLELAG